MKKALQNKSPGFRMTLLSILLSVMTIIVYSAIYASTNYMSWTAVGMMALGIVLSLVLSAMGQFRFAPTALFVGDYVGFLFFAYAIYFYISSVVTGIQFSGFPLSFFVNIGCFVVTLLFTIVSIFLRQTEKAEGGEKV